MIFPFRTYFPKHQFMMVLRQLASKWTSSRNDIETVSAEVQRALESFNTVYSSNQTEQDEEENPAGEVGKKGTQLFGKIMKHAASSFDNQYGGFGKPPKFPP